MRLDFCDARQVAGVINAQLFRLGNASDECILPAHEIALVVARPGRLLRHRNHATTVLGIHAAAPEAVAVRPRWY